MQSKNDIISQVSLILYTQFVGGLNTHIFNKKEKKKKMREKKYMVRRPLKDFSLLQKLIHRNVVLSVICVHSGFSCFKLLSFSNDNVIPPFLLQFLCFSVQFIHLDEVLDYFFAFFSSFFSLQKEIIYFCSLIQSFTRSFSLFLFVCMYLFFQPCGLWVMGQKMYASKNCKQREKK